MIKHLQKAYPEPLLTVQEYEAIEESLKPFFSLDYLTHYPCELCDNGCSPEIISESSDLYYLCETGYISLPQKIAEEEIARYKFRLKNFLKKISSANSINFYTMPINNKTLLFGEKELNGINHKFFYTNQLFSQNKLNKNTIYLLKEYFEISERAIILTPQNFILSNSDKSLLSDNHCQIIPLEPLLSNKLIINQISTSSRLDIENIIESNELVIINNEAYLYKKRLSLAPKAFKLLKIIGLKGKEGLSISYDDCIEYLWADEKIDEIDVQKQLQNHRSDINKACQNVSIEAKFIKVQNKYYKLLIPTEKVFIA